VLSLLNQLLSLAVFVHCQVGYILLQVEKNPGILRFLYCYE
jgi:hypothetical protein